MKITKEIVGKIAALLDRFGLCQGAGDSDTQFCVQQAVSKVISGDKNAMSDRPRSCVDESLVTLGIWFNDQGSLWKSHSDRAAALKRFAIAELGTAENFDRDEFQRRLDIAFPEGNVQMFVYPHGLVNNNTRERLLQAVDKVVQILVDMKSEGSQFLHLLDLPKKEAAVEAKKLGSKIWASQLLENMGYSCPVAQKQQH